MDRSALNFYDEGVVVYGAQRVLEGDRPYRDFWVLYPPGQFWVIAALFKLFGSSILVERGWDIAVRAAVASLSYLITAHIAPRPWALLAWAFSIAWLWAVGFHGYPLLPALALTLASCWFFIGALQKRSERANLFLAGLFVGVAIAFRHDIAFYVFLSEVVALRLVARSKAEAQPARIIWRKWIHDTLILMAGIAGPAVILGGYLIGTTPAKDLLEQLIVFPATVYPGVRSLPYPLPTRDSLLTVFPFYFHFIVLGAAMVFLFTTRKSKDSDKTFFLRGVVLFLSVLVGLLFLKSLVRPHVVHMIHFFVPTFILAACLMAQVRKELILGGMGLILASALCGMTIFPVVKAQEVIDRTESLRRNTVLNQRQNQFPRAGGLVIDANQAAAVKYVQDHVPPKGKIFVGAGRHDTLVFNDVLFYFLSERDSATRYHELHPGQITTRSVQQEIVEELQREHVEYVVLYVGADHYHEPNRSGISSHVTVLDDFLGSHYETVEEFGKYKLLRISK